MKTALLLISCLILLSITTVRAQDEAQSTPKSGQVLLTNDFYAGYGALGLFYWTGRMAHSSGYPSEVGSQTFTEPTSPGTFFVGYNRNLNKVVAVGFMFGLQNFTYTGKTTYGVTTDYNDLLIGGMAKITFCYLNKPNIRMYSGIGIGLTMNFGTADQPDQTITDRKLFPGGQFTLMGIRFGRALGGFVEFGMGTMGIVNAGISYKFKD
jgi:hypothetical protein